MLRAIGANLRYSLRNTLRTFGVSLIIMAILAVYWSILAGEKGDSWNQPFFLIISMLIPYTMAYQNESVYMNFALGMCSTRRSAFLAAQIGKVVTALLFAAAANGMQSFSAALSGHSAPFDWAFFAVCVLFILLFISLGEVIGYFTHRFGKAGAILFGVTCGLFGGTLGFCISMVQSRADEAEKEALMLTTQILTQLPPLFYLAVAALILVLPVVCYFCFVRKYVVK